MKHAIYEKALLLERGKTGKLYAHKKIPDRAVFSCLNQGDEIFILMVDAKVFYLVTGNVLFESEFLAVNK